MYILVDSMNMPVITLLQGRIVWRCNETQSHKHFQLDATKIKTCAKGL